MLRPAPVNLASALASAEAALDAEWQQPALALDRPPRVRRARKAASTSLGEIAASLSPEGPLGPRSKPAPAAPVVPGMLATREDQVRYVTAGYVDQGGSAHGGRITVVSLTSGTRFTYQIKPPTGPGKTGGACRKCEGGYWQGRRNYPCFSCKGTGVVDAPAGAPERLFVAVLTGPDNGADYTYLGQIVVKPRHRFEHGRKSRIGIEAPSAKAAQWYFSRLFGGGALDGVEVWHDGSCARCGRDLTDPLSIRRGIGPDCWERMGLG